MVGSASSSPSSSQSSKQPLPNSAIPQGYHSITPSVVVDDAAKALAFYREAFGATGSFLIYVPDADAAVERAVKAGAKVLQPVENQFWGDRMGTVADPFGHKWMLGTHVEDVPPEEMQRRGEEWARRHQ